MARIAVRDRGSEEEFFVNQRVQAGTRKEKICVGC
ncbi:hypothetical protein AO50_04046, partial [Mycobacterium tuberculosis M1914]